MGFSVGGGGRLPTEDRLCRSGFQLASRCSVCGASSKSVDHLFIKCPLATALWETVFFAFQRRVSADTWGSFFRQAMAALSLVWRSVYDTNRLGIGCMRSCVDDLLILRQFGLSGLPGGGGCGGVFRTCRSFVKACFAVPLGQVFAFEVELLAASLAINYAWNLGWHRIWLESDSSYVVQLLSIRSNQVIWLVHQAWQRCIHQISHMEFQVSHIFR
ncbi:hypothetical protein Dsin_021730 [Dipteronia sinensis]|uniref:RNase H type-1 domain-containing protein n=1 Tax=Dipteronia sinensis TaxID=43782 RepID=A0AAE0A079_9ROSI|nr:hypothetical protein Dsin_021730 [Dipteronia sinensis]